MILNYLRSKTPAERQRIVELGVVVILTLFLIGLSRLETRLLELSKSLSENQDFFTSIIFFGQINFNVILALLLAGLVFRNVAKLLIERKRGAIGSRLKAKLVASLVFFALAPTVLMFYISYRFITTSFDTWFSVKVQETMQQTREAGAQVYRQDQRRVESLARIALQRVSLKYETNYPGQLPTLEADKLKGFATEYRIDKVSIYDYQGRQVWTSDPAGTKEWKTGSINLETGVVAPTMVATALERFVEEPGLVSRGVVENQDRQDVVRGMAPIYDPRNRLVGIVATEEFFETQILRSIEAILSEFASLRPGAQLIRLSYVILLVVMVLIIVFSAVWLGFYVARAITGPIQSLAEATKEVALGNYDVSLKITTDDEAGMLMRQFNQMTSDLQTHRQAALESQKRLQDSNEELERRRKYMEIVLRNINTGLITVDRHQMVTSISQAAKTMLALPDEKLVGQVISNVLGEQMVRQFWQPVLEVLEKKNEFSSQMTIDIDSQKLDVLVAAAHFYDDNRLQLGTVIVFDDVTERGRVQRMAAWREVARRIAHEIKNPITPIMLNAQRLQRRYSDKFEGDDREIFTVCLGTILTQVDSLKRMVNEFSKFSRLPAIATKKEDLNLLLRDVVSMYRMSYPDLEFDDHALDEALPKVDIDIDQMNRVFVNLLTNAIDALSHQIEKKITISSQYQHSLNTVRLVVADNGPGIPEKLKSRVTEPYFSTKKQGTGLGLSIVNQIVSEHGGYMRIESEDGKGTRVIIELPVQVKLEKQA